ncbi:MAG: phenylacetate--CoA ligase family protein [Candidatus Nanohaloarchaea archaeon]
MLLRKLYYYHRLSNTQYLSDEKLEERQERLLSQMRSLALQTDFYDQETAETTRQDVIENFPDNLTIDPEQARKKYLSSGSSGDRITSVFDRQAWDYSEAAYLRALRATRFNPLKKTLYYWYEDFKDSLLNRAFMRKKRVSCEAPLDKQLEAINGYRPDYLYYYPSMLFTLAKYISGYGKDVHFPDAIYTHGELLTEKMREKIEETFNAPVYDRYSSAEFNVIGWECENQNMHLNSDMMHFSREEVREGEELKITSLINSAMPLLQYRTGDIVSSTECGCGRNLETVKIMGRKQDFISTENALIKPSEMIDSIADIDALLHFRVVKSDNSFTLRYVENKSFEDKALSNARRRLEDLTGHRFKTEKLEKVRPLNRGKLPMVINDDR